MGVGWGARERISRTSYNPIRLRTLHVKNLQICKKAKVPLFSRRVWAAVIIMSVKLFVGGLSWNTTDDALRDAFAKYGEVILISNSSCEIYYVCTEHLIQFLIDCQYYVI